MKPKTEAEEGAGLVYAGCGLQIFLTILFVMAKMAENYIKHAFGTRIMVVGILSALVSLCGTSGGYRFDLRCCSCGNCVRPNRYGHLRIRGVGA